MDNRDKQCSATFTLQHQGRAAVHIKVPMLAMVVRLGHVRALILASSCHYHSAGSDSESLAGFVVRNETNHDSNKGVHHVSAMWIGLSLPRVVHELLTYRGQSRSTSAKQAVEPVAFACQLLTRFESQDRLRVRLLVPRGGTRS